jgi:protein TonB
VLAAHVGCTALALMHWQEDASDDAAASSVIVDMVPTPSVSRVDSPDVAHGPPMEEATLTPQAAKDTKEEVEKETPPVDPSPLAPEPEVVLPVARPIPEKKPEEELPKEEVPKQLSADQTTAAPLTTAPPRVDASEPAPAVAPAPGASASIARVRVSWEKALVKHLDRFKRYPEIARQRQPGGSDRPIHGRPDWARDRRAPRAQLRVVGTRRGGPFRLEAGRPTPAGTGSSRRNDLRPNATHSVSHQMRPLHR